MHNPDCVAFSALQIVKMLKKKKTKTPFLRNSTAIYSQFNSLSTSAKQPFSN
jgi:hypothetical protein